MPLTQNLISSLTDAVFVLRPDGTVQFLNPAAVLLFGFPADEVQGRRPEELWVPSSARADYQRDVATIGSGKLVQPFETIWRHKDGGTIEVAVAMSSVQDEVGKYLGAANLVRDLRIENQTLRRLWDIQVGLVQTACLKETDRLMATIWHELSQPLAVINLLGDAIAETTTLTTARKNAERIVQEVAKIQTIMRRARNGNTTPDRQLIDINALIRRSVEAVLMAFRPSNVQTTIDLDEQVTAVSVDAGQIEQVLVNLVRNALEAMPQGGRLQISTVRNGKSLEIAVEDEGPGVCPSIAEGLFQPYVTTKQNGLGIGLSICREIITAHGGELFIRTDRTVGACFVVRIPLE